MSSKSRQKFFLAWLSIPYLCKMYWYCNRVFCGRLTIFKSSIVNRMVSVHVHDYVHRLAYSTSWNQRVNECTKIIDWDNLWNWIYAVDDLFV